MCLKPLRRGRRLVSCSVSARRGACAPPTLTGQVHGLQEPGHQGAVLLPLSPHEAQLPAHLLQVVPAELSIELLRQDGLGQLEGQRGVQGLGQLLQVPLAHLGLPAVRVAPGGVGGIAHVVRVVPAAWGEPGAA